MAQRNIIILPYVLLIVIARSTASEPKLHTVDVGRDGGSVFDPDTTIAGDGDVVIFRMFPTNHSVVRGEYAESDSCGSQGCNPCIPYEMIYPNGQGFDSGNIITQISTADNVPTFNVTIKGTSPIWVYCTALNSCHPNGMVAVINPAKGTTIAKQKLAAKNAQFQLLPGQPWPAEGSTLSSETSTPSALTEGRHLTGGAIAGIVMGVLIAISIIGGISYYVTRLYSKKWLKTAAALPVIPYSSVPERPVRPSVGESVWSHNASQMHYSASISPVEPSQMGYYNPELFKSSRSPPPNHPAFGQSPGQPTTIELPVDGPLLERERG